MSSVLHYPKWTTYGLKWRYRGVDDEGYAVLMDHAGKSALEVKDRDVLLMIIHLQSSSPIQFTSLKKTVIQQSSVIDALMKRVRIGAGIQA